MGRKVHPIGFRLGIIKEHKSRWFAAGKQYTTQLAEDRKIREMVFADLAKASVSNVDIERQPNQVHVIIDTARPGVIIGKKGESVNKLRTDRGLPPLALDKAAQRAAMDQAGRMASAGKMEHNIGFGANFLKRMKGMEVALPAAENIDVDGNGRITGLF